MSQAVAGWQVAKGGETHRFAAQLPRGRFQEISGMAFYPLEKLMFLEDGYRREFVIDGIPILLLQEDGQRHLIRNQCPHRGNALTTGEVADGRIRCPQHGWSFTLSDGRCRLPGPGSCLTRYKLVYEGNQVGIER